MAKAPGSSPERESHVFGVIRKNSGQSRRTGEGREERVSRKQEVDCFGPSGEVRGPAGPGLGQRLPATFR